MKVKKVLGRILIVVGVSGTLYGAYKGAMKLNSRKGLLNK